MSATVELLINSQNVDLKEGFPISLNYSIADIMKPDTRQTSYSKTIVIPASKENRALFSYIFELSNFVETDGEINYQPDFNPNLKASAVVLCDGVEVFNGIAQLLKISINENNKIEFEIVLTGQLTNLFKNIGDSELTDLDFSELNHDYTLDEIEDSWTNSSGFVYPLIDYGRSQVMTDFPLSSMFPSIFVKDYIDKIFSGAACVYDSDFFNSDYFKSLIIPFNGSNFKITNSEILQRKFRASRETSDQSMTVSATLTNTAVVFNDDTTAPNFDSSAQYNPANGLFTIGTGLQGNYNFGINLNITALYTPDTPSINLKATHVIVCNIVFLKTDINSGTTILSSAQLKIRQGADGSFSINTSTETSGVYPDGNYIGSNSGNVSIQSGQIEMLETESVRVFVNHYYSNQNILGALPSFGLGSGYGGNWSATELFIDASNNLYNGTYAVKVKIDSAFYNEIANADYVEGLPINMNNAVPVGVKQKDFLMSIIKMHNLYLEQDRQISNKFIIEPRDDGYYLPATSQANIVDLSKKIDTGENPLEIEPMGALDFKRYHFKYKEDKDYFNQLYLNKWGETYSERQVEIINDFIKEVKTTDVIFSATPSYGNDASNRIIPRILNFDTNGIAQPVTSNIRILIYDGLKSTNQAWSITDSSGQNFYTNYPYAGMLDDPYNPTVSLDWEVPDEIFWTNIFGTINYTNKNLYNQFYKKFIEEITNRNSSIVTGLFDIRPYDFTLLDFRKIYFFENEYFRLNKIIDYNPVFEKLTKLEFIKVNEGITTSFNIDEATDVYTEDEVPRLPRTLNFRGNIHDFGTNVSGKENRIASSVRSAVVSGDRNMIGEFAKDIFISGSENEIAGDSSGVIVLGNNNRVTGSGIVLINTNNKTINASNTTFIDGRAVSGSGSIVLVTSNRTIDKNNDDDATTYLIDATSGNITIDLFTASDWPINVRHTFKKIDSTSNTVTINPFGTETIDGSLTKIIYIQWDEFSIFTDGVSWFVVDDSTRTNDILANFGDGSDGDVTISANTNLSNNMYYNNLTINNGFNLNPSGYKIYVKGTLTINGTVGSTGTTGNGGANGTLVAGGAGGAALSALTGAEFQTQNSAAGGNGGGIAPGNGALGGTSANGNNIIPGNPGASGGGGAGLGSAGGGGVSAGTAATFGFYRHITHFFGFGNNTVVVARGGHGGGGGGGSLVGGGGGGGGGGRSSYCVFISANIIINNNAINSKGGNGGRGGNGFGNGGGGGGGSGSAGGFIYMIYKSYSGSGTKSVSGGTGGTGGTAAGTGTNGTNGNNGSAGKIVEINLLTGAITTT